MRPVTTVTRAIRIAAPPDLVWQLLGDVSQQMRWMRHMRQLHVETPGPLRVGWRGSPRVRTGATKRSPVRLNLSGAGTCLAAAPHHTSLSIPTPRPFVPGGASPGASFMPRAATRGGAYPQRP
jgi:hypothetical protein